MNVGAILLLEGSALCPGADGSSWVNVGATLLLEGSALCLGTDDSCLESALNFDLDPDFDPADADTASGSDLVSISIFQYKMFRFY